MHDYLLHELARIRMDELRAEASSERPAQEIRGSWGWRHHLGILVGARTTRARAVGFSSGSTEEVCCA